MGTPKVVVGHPAHPPRSLPPLAVVSTAAEAEIIARYRAANEREKQAIRELFSTVSDFFSESS